MVRKEVGVGDLDIERVVAAGLAVDAHAVDGHEDDLSGLVRPDLVVLCRSKTGVRIIYSDIHLIWCAQGLSKHKNFEARPKDYSYVVDLYARQAVCQGAPKPPLVEAAEGVGLGAALPRHLGAVTQRGVEDHGTVVSLRDVVVRADCGGALRFKFVVDPSKDGRVLGLDGVVGASGDRAPIGARAVVLAASHGGGVASGGVPVAAADRRELSGRLVVEAARDGRVRSPREIAVTATCYTSREITPGY